MFKTKTDAHGDLARLKARLVACENEQVFGVDYQLTFAAVMDMSMVKILIALAATWGVLAKHGDIPNAYVKAKKESHLEIFLQIPQGMDIDQETMNKLGVSSKNELSLELCKSLYGLKQAGRLLSQLLYAKLCDAGFTQCVSNMCLYWKLDGKGIVVVGVYVNDLLVTGTNAAAVDCFFEGLSSL